VCYQGSANTNLYNDNDNDDDNNNDHNTVDLSEHWVVMDDVCAHRLVPLSEGRINRVVAVSSSNKNNNSNSNTPANDATTTTTTTTTLQCSYHGWEFDGNHQGQCVNIPQATSKIEQSAFQSPRSCVTSYSVRVHKNVLWYWPWPEDSLSIVQDYPRKHPEGMMESIARIPPGTGGSSGGNNHNTPKTYTRDLPYGWDTLVENLIDPSHIPFAHHNLQGKREDAIPIEMTVPEAFPTTTVGTNTTTTTTGSNNDSNSNDGGEGGFFFEWQDRTMGKFRGGIGEFNAPFGVAYEGIFYKTKEKADAARGSHIAGKRILLRKKAAAAAAAAITSTNTTDTVPSMHEDGDDEDDRGDSNNNNNNNNAEEEPDLFQLRLLCIPTKPGWSRAIIITGGGSSAKEDTQTEKRDTTNTETPATTKSLSKTKKKKKKKKKSLVGLIFSTLPPWVIHLLSNKFLDSDLAFLHYQEQERLRYRDDNDNNMDDADVSSGSGSGRTASSPLSAHYFMPAASDRCIAALGKWIPKHTDYLGGDGSGDSDHNHKYTLPPPISSRTELFNRYKQHTSHCRHCQQGLQTLQTRVRRGTYGALIVSVLAGHFASPPAAAAAAGFFRGFRFMTKITALLSLGILRWISKIEAAFKEGEFKHYENN